MIKVGLKLRTSSPAQRTQIIQSTGSQDNSGTIESTAEDIAQQR